MKHGGTLALLSAWLATGVMAGAQLISTNRSDSSWLVLRGSIATSTNWTSDLNYDDSEAVGWTNAFQISGGNGIWHTSNQSATAPNIVRFRKKITLPPNPIVSASLRISFDDRGEAWVNGTRVINDTGGQPQDVVLEPGLLVAGENLLAVFARDTIAPNCSINVRLIVTNGPPDLYQLTLLEATNSWQLRFAGAPLRSYAIQHSTNLAEAWTNLFTTVTSDASGIILTNIVPISSSPGGFFRVVE